MPAESTNRRRRLRVRYLVGEPRPHLKVMGGDYPVIDLSEQGVRFSCGSEISLKVGQPLHGYLILTDGLPVAVEGIVLRLQRGEAMVFTKQQIPQEIVLGTLEDKRAFFRLRYPQDLHPTLHYSPSFRFEVTEISAFGLRFHGTPSEFPTGSILRASILFVNNVNIDIPAASCATIMARWW